MLLSQQLYISHRILSQVPYTPTKFRTPNPFTPSFSSRLSLIFGEELKNHSIYQQLPMIVFVIVLVEHIQKIKREKK